MKNALVSIYKPNELFSLSDYIELAQKQLINKKQGSQVVFISDLQIALGLNKELDIVKNNVLDIVKNLMALNLNEDVYFVLESKLESLPELTMLFSNYTNYYKFLESPYIKSELQYKKGTVAMLMDKIMVSALFVSCDADSINIKQKDIYLLEEINNLTKTINSKLKVSFKNANLIQTDVIHLNNFVGLDGNRNTHSNFKNSIYFSDNDVIINKKVMSIYTDPNHIKITDPGCTENNPLFIYLEMFSKNEHFAKYLPEYKNLNELKEHYQRGGLGDAYLKKFLEKIILELVSPIRQKTLKISDEEVFERVSKDSMQIDELIKKLINEIKENNDLNYLK